MPIQMSIPTSSAYKINGKQGDGADATVKATCRDIQTQLEESRYRLDSRRNEEARRGEVDGSTTPPSTRK